MSKKTLQPTDLTRLKRTHERGAFDLETIHEILDASPLCHIGYQIEDQPAVTPTLQWRIGNRVYWHGSSASRAMRRSTETKTCLTVTLLDGYVLARSGFSHSVNFRSVMVFGTPVLVTDPVEKEESLRAMVDHMIPGRWPSLRPVTPKELKATAVLWMPIDEASAKIRSGGPLDEEDYDWPVWAGTIPMRQVFDQPITDENSTHDLPTPDYVFDLVKSSQEGNKR